MCDLAWLVLGDACASWREGNIAGVLAHLLDDVVFNVHALPGKASIVGEGMGKALFGNRLAMLLDEIEVQRFDLQGVVRHGLWHFSRVEYIYRHRATGMRIDGSMRHQWGFVGARIGHFEVFHDSARMCAFFDMAGLLACGGMLRG
jgi:hypothetical protein